MGIRLEARHAICIKVIIDTSYSAEDFMILSCLRIFNKVQPPLVCDTQEPSSAMD
jgi:hypothetical protein